MNHLPVNLYTAAQVRELDRVASAEFNLPGLTLMERAGAACFAQLRAHWPAAREIGVLCGVGNNGGDGLVIARLAHEAGLVVDVRLIGERSKIAGDALHVLRRLEACGVRVLSIAPGRAVRGDVWVDALFGTGLKDEVSGVPRAAIEALNSSGVPVLSVDIPSGLNADTGCAMGVAVRATVTVTFIGLKQGLLTADGADYRGRWMFDDLAVPSDVYARVPAPATRITPEHCGAFLTPRARHAHKGAFGHVLVIGGEVGMSGAARLAGEAAARVGAGLVSIATRAEHAALLSVARPELMCHPVENPNQLRPLLERAGVVAIGPGLGQGPWGRGLFAQALQSSLPLIIDADALHLLAQDPVRREHAVLTPHPGEAARLLGMSVAEVQRDRFAAVSALQERFGGVVVLKGAGTLVAASPHRVQLCDAGNPGMASGGMGDVLTGIIAGLIAQGLALPDAAALGVWVHATAGDRAARNGERGLLAGDVLVQLRGVVNPS